MPVALDTANAASRFVPPTGWAPSFPSTPVAPKPAAPTFDLGINDSQLYNSGGPSEADIQQDALGDCYFVATLGAVAKQNPDAIRNMISYDKSTREFTVTLHDKDGKPQQIKVSQNEVLDNILFRHGGSTADNTNQFKATWPAVVETAYAKMHDSNPGDGLTEGYNAIANGGWPKDAMQAITGDRGDEITYGKSWFESEGSALDREAGQINAAVGNGRPVTLWTVPEHRGLIDKILGRDGAQDGLADNHVYIVDGVHKNADGEWMVTLRNPWNTNANVGEGHDTNSPTIDVPLRTLADTGGGHAFTVGPAH